MPTATPQYIAAFCVIVLAAVALGRLLVASRRRASLAEGRARLLLRDILTEEEQRSLAEHDYLEVASGRVRGRVYRIPRNAGRVRLYENGQVVCELCLQATTPLPASDRFVLHKLLIEGAEEYYLTTANRFLPTHGSAITPFLVPMW